MTDTAGTITLPFETVERVTDALNRLLRELDRDAHGDPTAARTSDARTALRELATMTSAGTGLAEDLRDQIAALEGSRQRLVQGIGQLQDSNAARTEALAYIAAVCDDQRAASEALGPIQQAARAALQVSNTPRREPRFMVHFENGAQACFHSLTEIREANREDEALLRFLDNALVGDFYKAGGGAAPIVTTWRVA